MAKLRVAILFGGRSTEHDVSLVSALGVLQNIPREKYEILLVKISRDGKWQLLPSDTDLTLSSLKNASGPLVLPGNPSARGFFIVEGNSISFIPVDVVFSILHGTFGEDGTVQGLLALADIPCVGGGVLASALGMDKILMKQIFIQNDLLCTDFIWFIRKKWASSQEVIRKAIIQEIGFPCFVKPANGGSSVGTRKVKTEEELSPAIDFAFQYDRKVLVEKAVQARELECAVLGNDDPSASGVGEIVPANEFYDYEAKYHSSESKTIIPAEVPEHIAKTIQRYAVQAFKAIDCAGMARVDFFLEKGTNAIFINEINTIPGFTPISMYPKLWEASGISYSELIHRLIQLAIERHEDLSRSLFYLKTEEVK